MLVYIQNKCMNCSKKLVDVICYSFVEGLVILGLELVDFLGTQILNLSLLNKESIYIQNESVLSVNILSIHGPNNQHKVYDVWKCRGPTRVEHQQKICH